MFVVRCRNDDSSFVTGTVTGRRGGLLQVVGASVQTFNVERAISGRLHFNSGFTGCVLDGVVEGAFFVELYFLSTSFVAVQTEAGALQLITRVSFIVILGVVQLVGVHTDCAFGSEAPVCAISGVIRVLELYFVFVIGRAIDSGIFVQVCSIGDRNSSAGIQIEPCSTGLDIRNAYHKIVITFKTAIINFIHRRIVGDIIGNAIGFNDYTIESVISNAIGQGIIEQDSVLFIVIVSTVGACGQGSGQLELELFVDRMVSAGTKTCFVGAILIVINFLLNIGLYNLMINCKAIVCFGNFQQEGIVGMIEIAKVKVGSINDQIITWLWNFEATGVTCSDGFRVCVCIRVEIVAYNARKSDAVIIRITPFADNRKNVLSSEISFKVTADGRICHQLRQKLVRISDVAAPLNVGNRIVITNITREDLESAVTGECVEVLLSVVCKRRDRHGAHHGNCQQCGQQRFDYFLHHDLRKSPFKFF